MIEYTNEQTQHNIYKQKYEQEKIKLAENSHCIGQNEADFNSLKSSVKIISI